MSENLGNPVFSNMRLSKNSDDLIMIPKNDGTFAPLLKKDPTTGKYFFNTEFVHENFDTNMPKIVISTIENRVFKEGDKVTVTATILNSDAATFDAIKYSIGTLVVDVDLDLLSASSTPYVYSGIYTCTDESASNQQIKVWINYTDDSENLIGYGQSITVDNIAPSFTLTNGDNGVLHHHKGATLNLILPEFDDLSSDANMITSEWSPNLDINAVGQYIRRYTATDSAGNTTTKNLTVIISAVSEETQSVIVLNGENPLYFYYDFIDPKAELRGYNGTFKKNLMGTRTGTTLLYEDDDNTPNKADSVTRRVHEFTLTKPDIIDHTMSDNSTLTVNFTKPHSNHINAAIVSGYLITVNIKDGPSTVGVFEKTIQENATSFEIKGSELPLIPEKQYEIGIASVYFKKNFLQADTDQVSGFETFSYFIESDTTNGAVSLALSQIPTSRLMNSVSTNEKTVNVYANLNKVYVSGEWDSSQTIYGIEFDIDCKTENIVNVQKNANAINNANVTVNLFDEGSDKTTIVAKGYNNVASDFDNIKLCTIVVKNVDELRVTNVNFSAAFQDWNTKLNDNLNIEDFGISGKIIL